jgi:hypothetical protein
MVVLEMGGENGRKEALFFLMGLFLVVCLPFSALLFDVEKVRLSFLPPSSDPPLPPA